MTNSKKKPTTYTGILLRKPRLTSSKATYLDVKTDVIGRTLQWVVFNANFDKEDLKQIRNAEADSVLTILGTTNVNAMTGQDQIVVQKLLNIADASANAEEVVVRETDDILELFKSLELEDFTTPTPELISMTWKNLNALMAKLPKQKAIGMLAKQIAFLNGETSNV